jgi:hypothetical protein
MRALFVKSVIQHEIVHPHGHTHTDLHIHPSLCHGRKVQAKILVNR